MKKIFLILVLLLTSCSFAKNFNNGSNLQSISAVFEEYDGLTYSFKYMDEDGYPSYIYFDAINESELEKYNLNLNEFVGEQFIITYSEEIVIESNEFGDSEEYTKFTITTLKIN